MDGTKLWSGNMRMKRKRRSTKIRRKIFKMGIGNGGGNSKVHGERGGTEREAERKSRKKSMDVRKEVGRRKRKRENVG